MGGYSSKPQKTSQKSDENDVNTSKTVVLSEENSDLYEDFDLLRMKLYNSVENIDTDELKTLIQHYIVYNCHLRKEFNFLKDVYNKIEHLKIKKEYMNKFVFN